MRAAIIAPSDHTMMKKTRRILLLYYSEPHSLIANTQVCKPDRATRIDWNIYRRPALTGRLGGTIHNPGPRDNRSGGGVATSLKGRKPSVAGVNASNSERRRPLSTGSVAITLIFGCLT